MHSARTAQSSNARLAPSPEKGYMVWQASPSRTALVECQGQQRTATRGLTECSRNSAESLGTREIKSGKFSAKKRATSASRASESKLFAPERGRNRLPLNEPPKLGRALMMNPARGHMWSACFSIKKPPSGPGECAIPCTRTPGVADAE